MKHLIVVFVIILSALIFFSCQDDNLANPESSQNEQTMIPDKQSDHRFSPFTKAKTSFTGTSHPVQEIEPGKVTQLSNGKILVLGTVAEWYDEASDSRVTGQSIWVVNKLVNPDGSGRLWGSAEINVDGDGGKWKMIWWGNLTPEGITAYAIAHGVEGSVRGLTAQCTYTMVFANGIFYTSEGFIIEK